MLKFFIPLLLKNIQKKVFGILFILLRSSKIVYQRRIENPVIHHDEDFLQKKQSRKSKIEKESTGLTKWFFRKWRPIGNTISWLIFQGAICGERLTSPLFFSYPKYIFLWISFAKSKISSLCRNGIISGNYL